MAEGASIHIFKEEMKENEPSYDLSNHFCPDPDRVCFKRLSGLDHRGGIDQHGGPGTDGVPERQQRIEMSIWL